MKGLDWSNERYVRLHVRNTTSWALLGYETQCLWLQLLRMMDRSGVIPLEPDALPHEGIAALLPGSNDRQVEKQLESLVDRGWLVHNAEEGCFVDPDFIEREETPMSDKQRQRESRARRARTAVTKGDKKRPKGVTNGDGMSQMVTDGHDRSQPVTPSVPPRTVPSVPTEEHPKKDACPDAVATTATGPAIAFWIPVVRGQGGPAADRCREVEGKAWKLEAPISVDKVEEWREHYNGADVETHIKAAQQWSRDNDPKTARGMTAFIGQWLSTARKRGEMGGPGGNGGGFTRGRRRRGQAGRQDETKEQLLDKSLGWVQGEPPPEWIE